MFSSTLNRCCIIFRVIGLGTSSSPASKKSEKGNLIFRFFNCVAFEFYLKLLFVVVDTLLLIRFSHKVYFFLDLMGAVNDIIKYLSTVFTTILILVESHRKGDTLWRINELATEFQQKMLFFMRPALLSGFNKRFWRKYTVQFASFTIFFLTSEVALFPVYLLHNSYKYSFILLVGNNVFITICRYRHLQHIFYMSLVHHQLELLIKVLRDRRFMMTSAKLQRLQELYEISEEMVTLQNDFFGLSQAMNLIFNHLQLLGDAYWNYWRYLNSSWSPGSLSECVRG